MPGRPWSGASPSGTSAVVARILALLTLLVAVPVALSAAGDHLFVWAADADGADPDFVAVLDARQGTRGYGEVVATLPIARGAGAHHSEYEMPADGRLFVNGFASGRSFVVDLRRPRSPRLIASFEARGDLAYAHSFARLPGGNVLATFQSSVHGSDETGGLAELDPKGDVVRAASAAEASRPSIRPYSLAVVPALDRVVSTTTDMRGRVANDTVQVWRASDLELLATVVLPRGPRGTEAAHPVEPRLLGDGRTVLVVTFGCGLYRLLDLDGAPRARLVHAFAHRRADGVPYPDATFCAVPAVVDDVWVQTVPARDGLVAIDVADPAVPRQVGFVDLGPDRYPHWLAADPGGRRLVVTGYGQLARRVVVVRLDPATGALEIDTGFGGGAGVDFERESWPHGATGAALPHGAVFSR
ncbi:MAG: hypothetical protein R3190_04225 [Thermoanaerobaculia bacterium]|nr:hypothetical protein [Thermoanaerobaculia bacterium]